MSVSAWSRSGSCLWRSGLWLLVSLVFTLPTVRVSGAPLLAWGKNWGGETNIPPAATNLLAVSVGWQHGLALRADGTLVPWGYSGGNLAVIPPEATNLVAIAVGDYHSLALRADGSVFAWGKNEAGESTVPASATNLVALDGGYSHTLALRDDGSVMAWGDNTFGQLNIPAEASNVVAIAAGMDHNVVLRGDGSVVVWGINQSGETNLPPSATNVVAISAGASHSLALRADGTIIPWGSTVFGETTVPTNVLNVKAISSGGWFNLAVLQNGAATGWGYNFNQQATPPSAVTNPAALYAGGEFSVAWLAVASNGIAPRIWKQPPARTLAGGELLYLHPGVNGTPPLRYQWHFNNAPMPGQTNRWLSLPNSNPTQSGDYRLVVSNNFGAVTSQVAAVTVAALQFLTQPAGVAVMMNEDVILSAAVAGTAPLTYRWLKDGQSLTNTARLSGADTPMLTNQWLMAADSGSYQLVVSNAYAVVTSQVAQVTVRTPMPLLNVDFGESFVSAKSGFAAVGQTDGDYWNGFPRGGLTVSNLLLADGSQTATSITITNSLFFAWIDEYADPMLQGFIYPPWQAGPFTVQIAGLPAGTYSFYLYNAGTKYWPWFGSDFELIVGGVSQGHYVLTGNMTEGPPPWRTGVHYGTFHNVQVTGPQQSVALVVRGNFGQDPNIAGLQIGGFLTSNSPPVFWSQPVSQFVSVGSNFVLAATGSGFPSPSQQWFFNDAPLTNDVHLTGVQSNRLAITGAQFQDAGDYYAVLTNASGVITSSIATIAVGIPPGLSVQPGNQIWIAGTTSSLVAAGTGTGPLTYRWQLGPAVLTNSSRISGAASNTLSVSNVLTSDAGTYTLVVSNPFGSITSTATVAVVVPPAFTRHPAGASVPVGMPLTLSATVSGTAPLNYQWLFNGASISGATTNSLSMAALGPQDFGDYQLVVSNYGGVITSATARVTVGEVAVWGTYGHPTLPIWPGPGLSNVISVAGGSGFSLALRADGTVYAWGTGTGTNVPAGLGNVVAISTGGAHALALRADGTVAAWGLGSSGQTNIPLGSSNVTMIAAGDVHSAALRRDGTVVVWGGSATQKQTNVPAGLMQVAKIAAGGSQTLAVRENGDVVGWGGSTPFVVPPYLHGVAQVAASVGTVASSGFALALLTNGTVTAWDSSGWPTNMFPGISNVVAVQAAGGSRDQVAGVLNACMILQSNGLVSGRTTGTSVLTNVPAGVSNAVAISGGYTHVLALLNAGRPLIVRPPVGGTFYTGAELRLKAVAEGRSPLSFQWHKDGFPVPDATNEVLLIPGLSGADAGSYHLVVTNELGLAQSLAVPVGVIDSAPVLLSQPASRYAWYGSPLAVGASVIGSGPMQMNWFQDGTPVAGGTNEIFIERVLPPHGGAYQFIARNPFGSVTSSVAQLTFSQVAAWGGAPGLLNAPIDLGSVLAVASGYTHALAIRSNRTVAVWGTTAHGVTNVPAGLSNVFAISGGNNFCVALTGDGTVAAWGSAGQTNVPAGLTNVVALSAGGSHALALRANGTVAAWGTSAYGVTNVPAGLSNVVAVAAGSTHSLTLKNDGTVVQWGNYGIAPVLTNIVAISAGYSQSLALQADGTVLAWTATKAPGPPFGLSNVVAISAGGGFSGYFLSVALRADGTLVAWGDNNASSQMSVPADVLSATAMSAGGWCTLALLNDRSPTITLQPWEHQVAPGTNISLRAFTVGQAPVHYQWYRDDELVPGETGNWLAFPNTHPSHNGAYQLIATNGYGAVTSVVAAVTVIMPQVTLSPLDLAGNSFRFSFISLAGVLYIVEFKDDLTSATWLELERRFGIGGSEIVTDALVGGGSRFYRVRALHVPSPKLGPASWNGRTIMFSFATVPGAVYVVEFKERLDDSTWSELSRQTGTGAPIDVSDPNSFAPSRFYRVRVE